MDALEEKSGGHQCHASSGNHECLQKTACQPCLVPITRQGWSKNTAASSLSITRPDTGWHIWSQNCMGLLVSSSGCCERLDCWKLPAQEQCTCIEVERGHPVVPNKKSIYACCPFPARRFFPCRLTFSLPDLLLRSNDYLPCFSWLASCHLKPDKSCKMIVLFDVRDKKKTMVGEIQTSSNHCRPEFTL